MTSLGPTGRGAGRPREELVIYEMHVGTFTPEGSWEAAARELPELAELGITCIELMPVAEFPGRFGWGYDGVDLFAPTRLYGRPDDFRRFVDRAHALGIARHPRRRLQPLSARTEIISNRSPRAYFTDRYDNEWGEAINFDGPDAGPVREFFLANAGYWIDEYHLDGLRLDATQQIFDASDDHILAADRPAGAVGGRGRTTFVVGENEPQQARLVRPAERGGYGLDALWNDDFHHSAMVALTGRHEAYYSDYRGRPREFVAAAKHGFLYQGQHYQWQRKRARHAGARPAGRMLRRLSAEPRPDRQFRHWAALSRTDQPGPLARDDRVAAVDAGHSDAVPRAGIRRLDPVPLFRRSPGPSWSRGARGPPRVPRAVSQPRDREMQAQLADPGDIETFRRCVLDLGERRTACCDLCAASRPARAAARGPGAWAAAGAGRRRGARRMKPGCCAFSARPAPTAC